MLDRRQILLGAATSAPLFFTPGIAFASPAAGDKFGIIEIGSSGLKVSAYTIAPSAIVQDDGSGVSGRERVRQIPKTSGKPYSVNTNSISGLDKDLDETARVAGEAVGRLTSAEFGVPRANIAVVASSGVAGVPGLIDKLAPRVNDKTGMIMDSIDAATESKLSYDWIVYEWRRQQVLLVDIGSGNTKGGYYENVGTKQQRFRDFSVSLGTKSFGNAIRKAWPDDPALAHADQVFNSTFLPQLNDQIASAPGLENRPRVYLVGGIIWATALLVRPAPMVSRSDWVRISPADFDTLAQMIRSGNPYKLAAELDLPKTQRDWLDTQVTSVSETFNADQLAAGNALCRGLAQRLAFSKRSAIFFAAFSVNAWSSQYLITKFRLDQSVAG